MFSSFLVNYKDLVERAIDKHISYFGPKNPLRDAIEYALKNGGKRFRPAILCMVAEALGKGNHVEHAALAIEFFHTASLIADDLPCMDDDAVRRELPTVHRVFGEATAILATYALIAAGYDFIRMGAQTQGRNEICPLAIENASYNSGILGATGGQYADLFARPKTGEEILEIIDKKTGTLFEISFFFGWLYGGGELSALEEVKAMARSFGRAFQLCDDLHDLEQDKEGMNYAALVGIEETKQLLQKELSHYFTSLEKLNLATPALLALGNSITN